MAKPDLEDGYLRYAHELDAALACADFTKGARIVLREVLSQIFGPAASKTAKIHAAEIVRTYGLHKSYIHRGIKELVESGVIVKVDDYDYQFVKNYENWTKNGTPRLSPEEIEAARTAPERAMSHKRSCGRNSVNSNKPDNDSHGRNLVNSHQSDDDTSGRNSVNQVAIQSTPESQSSQPKVAIQSTKSSLNCDSAHYVEHARIETGDRETREQFAPAHAREAIPNGRTGDDLRDWQEAIRILRSHKTTEKLADGLEMYADTPGVRQLAGWQIIQGARIIQQPHKSKDWPFFQGCCRQATREEFENWGKQISHPRNGKPPIRSDPLPPVFKAPPDWDHPSRRKGTA